MEDAIAAVRSFNRFYTRLVGATSARFLDSELTLPEARLLFEIADGDRPVAAELQRSLGIDAGYLSRVLGRFEARGWIVREVGEGDARRRPIALTGAGRAMFDHIDHRQRAEVKAMLDRLAPPQQADLVAALGSARTLLDPAPSRDFTIRTFRAGDAGQILARQSVLYLEEYGWGRGAEHNIAEALTAFLANYQEGREQCWVAETAGAIAGSILLTDEGGGGCRLRLFYVEPMARGRGIGEALVTTCLAFARQAGYDAMTLWTHTVLASARKIYAAHRFELVETAVHDAFGKPEQGETWRLEL
ncbi:MAG TPA: bifunctional helix-turn-helix transcriptional regulator/GNAT family N-acetyltransferase [Caulobacteraceae bacterium]|jgi:DNA-binding MarR family transcriptional regulator/GNAT superfamily N-acetyltransferase